MTGTRALVVVLVVAAAIATTVWTYAARGALAENERWAVISYLRSLTPDLAHR